MDFFLLLQAQAISPNSSITLTLGQSLALLSTGIIYIGGVALAIGKMWTNFINRTKTNEEAITLMKKDFNGCRLDEKGNLHEILDVLKNHSEMLGELKGDLKAHNSYHEGLKDK